MMNDKKNNYRTRMTVTAPLDKIIKQIARKIKQCIA